MGLRCPRFHGGEAPLGEPCCLCFSGLPCLPSRVHGSDRIIRELHCPERWGQGVKTPRLKIALYAAWFSFCCSACCEVDNSQSHFLLTRFCQRLHWHFPVPHSHSAYVLRKPSSQPSGGEERWVSLQVSVLGKIPDMFPGQPATRGFWFRGLGFFLLLLFSLLVTIMVFLVLRLTAALPFSSVKLNHDAVTVKMFPFKTTMSTALRNFPLLPLSYWALT